MCNAYKIGKNPTGKEWAQAFNELHERLNLSLIRRGGTGLVVTQQNGSLLPEAMRWGFPHEKYKLVNNARSDKLKRHGSMWKQPMAETRCLVPISEFYEWQEIPGTKDKLPHRFRRPDESWLWVAGLYGRFPDVGACYATITTEPTAQSVEIHDRLLAVVEFEEGLEFLEGKKNTFEPTTCDLVIEPCESPLKRTKPPPEAGKLKIERPEQGSLF